MAGFARVTLIGNLGAPPEVRFSAAGNAVCNLRVACTERAKVKGEWTDVTEWCSVVVFGKQGEACGQHLDKGSQVYVEGRLQTRKWQDKEGKDRYSTEILANQCLFLGGKKDGSGKAPASKASSAPSDGPPPLQDDDIPF